MSGRYETKHCESCDGTGRRHYAPNYDYKKTCLTCNGSGIVKEWILDEALLDRERQQARVAENRRLDVERRRAENVELEVERRRRAYEEAWISGILWLLGIGVLVVVIIFVLPYVIVILIGAAIIGLMTVILSD